MDIPTGQAVAFSVVIAVVICVALGFAIRYDTVESAPGSIAYAPAVGQTAELPEGWPVPELKLPPGATAEYIQQPDKQAGLAGAVSIMSEAEAEGNTIVKWKTGFDTGLNWTELLAFTDDCLRGMGYLSIKDKPQEIRLLEGVEYRWHNYISEDGLRKIFVYYYEEDAEILPPGFAGHEYEVWVLEEPMHPNDPSRFVPVPGKPEH